MELSEAEIQVLASLEKADIESAPTDRTSLEKSGERYSDFLEDWSGAFSSLVTKDLIEGGDSRYRLTDAGRPLGQEYHRERPDLYWYLFQKYYPAARKSVAHSRMCERAFGKDLCQYGMVDMGALEDLIARLDLKPGDHLLDLGCGGGTISEYISDQTGAQVTGLDYAAPSIDLANERTADKRSRLTFVIGDLNALDLPARSFDAVISLDTLYWVVDLNDTLSKIAQAIKPGGRMAIFIDHGIKPGEPPEMLDPDKTGLAQACRKLDLTYEAYDYTSQNASFWRRYRDVVIDLRDDFEAEGNGFIPALLIREAEEEFLPAIEAGTLARYLYHVRL